MPRTSVVPANVLLASSGQLLGLSDSMADNEESRARDAETQTLYRESEAQTAPYAPSHVLRQGEHPIILLMSDLTHARGLPLGTKEADAVEFAVMRRALELNMPPFTDEASLALRKRLMHTQEVKEMRMREGEIDAYREVRMDKLQRALADREETSEFATAQRVENLRAKLMDTREKKLQTLRNKRIKVLRRLAQARGRVDPAEADIIAECFDKGSALYAPRVRDGQHAVLDNDQLDVTTRTAALTTLGNVLELEASLPFLMDDKGDAKGTLNGTLNGTMNAGTTSGSAYNPRMTSASQRALRNAKRDVETMSQILALQKKREGLQGEDRQRAAAAVVVVQDDRRVAVPAPTRAKPRPPTPDLTRNRDESAMEREEEECASVILLQRLLRGRSAQNAAYEGRFRHAALIEELRAAAEEEEEQGDPHDRRAERDVAIRATSLEAVCGSVAAQLFVAFAEEHVRIRCSLCP